MRTTNDSSFRGYSLIEIAIALGVIGFVTSLVWGYATMNAEKVRRQQTLQQVQTVVNNIRGAYAGQMGIPGKGYSVLVPTLISGDVIPADMERLPLAATCTNVGPPAKVCADNLWGSVDYITPAAIDANGTFRICDWALGATACTALGGGGTVQNFAIEIRSIPYDACIQLATTLSSSLGPLGLAEVNINGCNILEGACPSYTPTPSFPVQAADANALCLTSKANLIDLIYNLRLPEN